MPTGFGSENLAGSNTFEVTGVDGRIKFKWISKK
jgi:hypothetical protein